MHTHAHSCTHVATGMMVSGHTPLHTHTHTHTSHCYDGAWTGVELQVTPLTHADHTQHAHTGEGRGGEGVWFVC